MKFLKVVSACSLGLVLAGCNTQPIKQVPQLPGWVAYVQDRHNQADVINVIEATGPAGEIKLAVTFASVSTKASKGHYNVVWFDQSGVPIDTILSRQTPLNLAAKERYTITAIAPGSRAAGYEIVLEN